MTAAADGTNASTRLNKVTKILSHMWNKGLTRITTPSAAYPTVDATVEVLTMADATG
jgi:hypothetical protein